MFGSTGQKRYDLRNRTTPADDWDRDLRQARPETRKSGLQGRDSVCGARQVSVPLRYGDQGSERQRLMRSLLRKRFACPACRTARRKGGPAAVGKAARIIGSNFLPHATIAQFMRNRFGKTRHNPPRIAPGTIRGAISCPCRRRAAQPRPAHKDKRPGGPGRLELLHCAAAGPA